MTAEPPLPDLPLVPVMPPTTTEPPLPELTPVPPAPPTPADPPLPDVPPAAIPPEDATVVMVRSAGVRVPELTVRLIVPGFMFDWTTMSAFPR
jgi:hypothetical protein